MAQEIQLLEALSSKGALDIRELNSILAEISKSDIETVLLGKGVTAEDILATKSELFGVPFRIIGERPAPMDALRYIPEDTARHYNMVPIGIADGVLEIGMLDPNDLEAREALQFVSSKFNVPFKVFLISNADFIKSLDGYKSLSSEVSNVVGELETALSDEVPGVEMLKIRPEDEDSFSEKAPVTRIVAVVIKHAAEGRASDIHIEPGRDKLRVRFRVDGVLYTSLLLPLTVHEAVVSRIKIMTNMQLDEKRRPQDGRFSTRINERLIDFRVSTFPTTFGEKVVLRILDPERGVKTLEDAGLSGRNLEVVSREIKRPYGMILVTGPTGSGKSTTLYAMLQILNQEKVNIVSLEDPVEYNVGGVNQSQVRPEIGYSFASGLRSILRQDPDIMMVGEIRDKETAQLAIHAALTGHLVLSTLHTNNAIGVIPRLIDMGVDPYLLAPTLIIAMGQRLVRTLCPDSREQIPITGKMKERLDDEMAKMPEEVKQAIKMPKYVYRAKPSATCPRGTYGRTAVFESIYMTKELERVILTSPSGEAIEKEARRQGMITMREDGILKVLEGTVGLEELDSIAQTGIE